MGLSSIEIFRVQKGTHGERKQPMPTKAKIYLTSSLELPQYHFEFKRYSLHMYHWEYNFRQGSLELLPELIKEQNARLSLTEPPLLSNPHQPPPPHTHNCNPMRKLGGGGSLIFGLGTSFGY